MRAAASAASPVRTSGAPGCASAPRVVCGGVCGSNPRGRRCATRHQRSHRAPHRDGARRGPAAGSRRKVRELVRLTSSHRIRSAVETALALAYSTVKCSSRWVWPSFRPGWEGGSTRREGRFHTVPQAGGTGAEAAGAPPHSYRRSRLTPSRLSLCLIGTENVPVVGMQDVPVRRLSQRGPEAPGHDHSTACAPAASLGHRASAGRPASMARISTQRRARSSSAKTPRTSAGSPETGGTPTPPRVEFARYIRSYGPDSAQPAPQRLKSP